MRMTITREGETDFIDICPVYRTLSGDFRHCGRLLHNISTFCCDTVEPVFFSGGEEAKEMMMPSPIKDAMSVSVRGFTSSLYPALSACEKKGRDCGRLHSRVIFAVW